MYSLGKQVNLPLNLHTYQAVIGQVWGGSFIMQVTQPKGTGLRMFFIVRGQAFIIGEGVDAEDRKQPSSNLNYSRYTTHVRIWQIIG